MWFPLSLGAEKDPEKQLLERLGVEDTFKKPRHAADISHRGSYTTGFSRHLQRTADISLKICSQSLANLLLAVFNLLE